MELKNTKIWIGEDADLSKKVQEKLFDLGYKWNGGSTSVSLYSDIKAIFIDEDRFTFTRDRVSFTNKDSREITIQELESKPTYKVGDMVQEGEIVSIRKETGSYIVYNPDRVGHSATGAQTEGFVCKPEWEHYLLYYGSPELHPIEPKRFCRFKTKAEFEEEYGSNWQEKISPCWNQMGEMDYLFGLEWDWKKTGSNSCHPDKTSGDPHWSVGVQMLTDKPLPTAIQPTFKTSAFTLHDLVSYGLDKSKGYIVAFGGKDKLLIYDPDTKGGDGVAYSTVDKAGEAITIPAEYKGHLEWRSLSNVELLYSVKDSDWWKQLDGKYIKILYRAAAGWLKEGVIYKVGKSQSYGSIIVNGYGWSCSKQHFLIVPPPSPQVATENSQIVTGAAPVSVDWDDDRWRDYPKGTIAEFPNGFQVKILEDYHSNPWLEALNWREFNISETFHSELAEGASHTLASMKIIAGKCKKKSEFTATVLDLGDPTSEVFFPIQWDTDMTIFKQEDRVVFPNGLKCIVTESGDPNPWMEVVNREDFPTLTDDFLCFKSNWYKGVIACETLIQEFIEEHKSETVKFETPNASYVWPHEIPTRLDVTWHHLEEDINPHPAQPSVESELIMFDDEINTVQPIETPPLIKWED